MADLRRVAPSDLTMFLPRTFERSNPGSRILYGIDEHPRHYSPPNRDRLRISRLAQAEPISQPRRTPARRRLRTCVVAAMGDVSIYRQRIHEIVASQ